MKKLFLVLALSWLALLGHLGDTEARDRRVPIVAGGGGGCSLAFVSAAISNNKVVTKSVTSGNLLVRGYISLNGGAQTPSNADTATNTWTAVSGSPAQDATNTSTMAMWWAIANSSTSITSTVTTTGTTFNGSFIAEYSCIAASPADGANKATNASGTTATDNIATGSVTTTVDGDLVVSFVANVTTLTDGLMYTQGTGWTRRDTASFDPGDESNVVFAFEDKFQSTAGAINPTWTGAQADKYNGITAAFKKQ